MKNTGEANLTNVTVEDQVEGYATTAATYVSGDKCQCRRAGRWGDLDLQREATRSKRPGYSRRHGTAVAGSYSNIGTASGKIGTTTVTDTDPSSYFGTSPLGQIAPTGTTVNQYIDGTAVDFDDYYASQGGVIQYNVNNQGKIGSTNPGVFFYYTGLSDTIKGFDGPDPGRRPI